MTTYIHEASFKCPYCGFENDYRGSKLPSTGSVIYCKPNGDGCGGRLYVSMVWVTADISVKRIEGEGKRVAEDTTP